MARPHKPAAIRALEGNRGHRPIPENELTGVGDPTPPARLTAVQGERWQDIVASLPDGLLSRADVSVLERMAVAWTTYREADDRINKTDMLVPGRDGNTVKNPLLSIRKQAAEEMQVCAMMLGLSPYARTRLAQPANNQDDDPMTQLMGMASSQPSTKAN
jgi:P27 family predicted phage terminase small subunit